MKPNNVFLFYYSLVATTILLIVSFFFLPTPQKIINIVLLAPVVFYLWIHAFNPDFFTTPAWNPKLGAISIVFCILGIFSYFIAMKLPNYLPKSPVVIRDIADNSTQSNSDDTELRSYLDKQFGILGAKIDSLGKRDNVLGLTIPPDSATPPQTPVGQITAKDANLTEIAVYDAATQSATVVGSAKYGLTYSYFEKNESWYKIAEGWVPARWFSEITP